MSVWYQPVPNCSSLILAVQVTGQWPGENSPARNRRGHRVSNTGLSAGAHPALIEPHSVVLVTHEDQGEKPRERRGTDGLVRWKGVWREQELWFVPKEATARWGSVLFTDEL